MMKTAFHCSMMNSLVKMTFISIIFFGAFANAADDGGFNFHLPSSIALSASSSTDQTRTYSGDVNLSLRNNMQLFAGYSRSNVVVNDDAFSFNEIRLGAGTDPLNDLSAGVAFSALVNRSDTRQTTAGLELMWSPSSWILTLTPGVGAITTSNRPNVYQQDSELSVKQTSLAASVEYFLGENFLGGGFSVRTFGATYSYDSNLSYFDKASQVSQALNVDVLPPSSQQLFSTLPDYQYGLGLNYSQSKWSVGLECSQVKTKLDDETDFALKLSGSYRVVRAWNLIASVGQLPSFTGDYDSSNRTARVGAIHTW